MINSNKIPDISKELLVCRSRNGIKLQAPDSHNLNKNQLPASPYSLADALNFPFNVYFQDTEGAILSANSSQLESAGLLSMKDIFRKTAYDFSPYSVAKQINDNNIAVLQENRIKIIEEHVITNEDDNEHTYLTIKSPWYDDENKLVGLFGCSILMDTDQRNDIANSLSLVSNLGLLSPDLAVAACPKSKLDEFNFSKRETDVVRLIVRGKTASEVANTLGLSKRTIEYYLVNIKMKAGVTSKSALIEQLIDVFA